MELSTEWMHLIVADLLQIIPIKFMLIIINTGSHKNFDKKATTTSSNGHNKTKIIKFNLLTNIT